MSLPLRKCGLKFLTYTVCGLEILSLPLRKCGLKLRMPLYRGQRIMSLPLRKCGLKSASASSRTDWAIVTSLAEVWIEILKRMISNPNPPSLPLRKCGLKLYKSTRSFKRILSLPLRKCGLKFILV